MAINKLMRLALKLLSYPDIDIRKTYQLERSIQYLKLPALLPKDVPPGRNLGAPGNESDF